MQCGLRYFVFAVFFACTIAIASSNLIANHQFPLVEAQDEDPPIRMWKTVQGSIPDSNWEYVWIASDFWDTTSDDFTIDRTGGGTTLNFVTSFRVAISEKAKSGYVVSIAYGSMYVSLLYGGTPETTIGTTTVKMTDSLVTDNVVTMPPLEYGLTYFVDFYNSYTAQEPYGYTGPRYVGGENTSVNKLAILAPYLGLIILLETLAVVMAKRKKKDNC